jgi:hypothetical protein
MDDSHLLITAGSDPPMSSKEHVKCVVHRIPNDRMTAAADPALAAIALIRVACPQNAGAVVGYSPKFVRQVISFQHGTASLLIGPHIEMGTLCDGSLCIAARIYPCTFITCTFTSFLP